MKIKDKVLAYIVRNSSSGQELLVFDHRNFPDAGTQVPAGTVKLGEPIENALKREVLEESGISLSSIGRFVGSYEWHRNDLNELHKRHVFFISLEGLKDSWQHIVTGSDDDNSLVFDYFWISLEEASSLLAANQGDYLEHI